MSKYVVRSFRGYFECDDYEIAVNKAEQMITDIIKDEWCDFYWWCEILNRYCNLSKIVSTHDGTNFSFSPWLSLR